MRGVGGADVFLPSNSKAFQGKEESGMDHAGQAEGGLEIGPTFLGELVAFSVLCF